MTDSRKVVLCLVALVVSAIVPLWAQTPIRIDPGSAGTVVQVSPLDSDLEKPYEFFFLFPPDQALKPHWLVLRNVSDQPVAAVSLVWTFTTRAGPRTMYSRAMLVSDGTAFWPGTSLLSPATVDDVPIQGMQYSVRAGAIQAPAAGGLQSVHSESTLPHELMPGETMLIAPGHFAYPSGRGSESSLPPLEGTEISVLVDAVASADGAVVGEDQNATIDALNRRNSAIAAIVSAVRAARQTGQDPVAVLEQFASPPMQEQDAITRIESQIVASLVHSPIWELQLKKLETKSMVNYHR